MNASNSTLEELESAALTAFSQRMSAKSEQSALRKKWDDIQELLPLVEEVIKYTEIHKRYKSLTGKKQTKFGKQCAYELSKYDRLFAKIREIIPGGKSRHPNSCVSNWRRFRSSGVSSQPSMIPPRKKRTGLPSRYRKSCGEKEKSA